MIKSIGWEAFYSNDNYSYLRDKELPSCFIYIFSVFLELYYGCTIITFFGGSQRNVTWQDIESYCRVRKANLTQIEIDYLLKIKNWVSEAINELEKEEK